MAQKTGLPLGQCQLMGLFPIPPHDNDATDSV